MKKNSQIAINIVAIAVGMFGIAYASVPLYNLFCKVTGFGGATVRAEGISEEVFDREITVLFNTDTSPDLPWTFKPIQTKIKVKIGENGLAFFEASNNSNEPVVGVATYNVTPLKISEYFNKVQCFCFDEQTLEPNQKMQFPVSFFIDPEIMNDKNLDEVKTVTLSYTFFRYKDGLKLN